MHTVKQLPQ